MNCIALAGGSGYAIKVACFESLGFNEGRISENKMRKHALPHMLINQYDQYIFNGIEEVKLTRNLYF